MSTSWWLLLSFLILGLTCLAVLLWYRAEDCQVVPPKGVSDRDWLKVTARLDRRKPAVFSEHHVDQRARFTQKGRQS